MGYTKEKEQCARCGKIKRVWKSGFYDKMIYNNLCYNCKSFEVINTKCKA